MNKKVFYILLIPVYLLLAVFVLFFVMGLTDQLNAFFYLILLLFIPCSYLISLTGRHRQTIAGAAGYLLLGVFLAGSQSFDFQFQEHNAWLLLGGCAVALGMVVSIYQYKQ